MALQNAFADLALDATVQVVADTVKVEDTASAGGEAGVTILGVRNDAAASKTSTDGDYSAIATDAAGRVGIADLGGSITVDGSIAVSNPGLTDAELRAAPVDVTDAALVTTNTNTGTTATNTTTIAGAVQLEDDVAASGDPGVQVLGVRNDAAATKTSTDGDYTALATDAAGRVGIADLGGSITVDGSIAVSNPGLTDAELRATPVDVTDAALVTTNNTLSDINIDQTNGTQKTQVVDGGGTVLDITAAGAALVEWVDSAGVEKGTVANPVVVDSSHIEDDAHTTGDRGAFMLGVRNDADAVRTSTDGDYSPVSVDSAGRIKVVASASALPTGAATEATQLNVLAAVDGIETLLATTATWTHGQATVGVASAQLASNAALRGVTVKAASSNTVSIYVGNATGVTTATGFELAPGDSIDLPVDNTNDVWHISGTAAQNLSWSAA